MSAFLSSLKFEKISSQDIETVIDLEIASYPEDEAATPEKIRHRAEVASNFFFVAKNDNQVVGFINGTCIAGKVITHASMSMHDVGGKTLVIHSVVTHPSFRRRGLALWMLGQYLHILHQSNDADDVLLLSKPNLLPLYMSAGFKFHCVSNVVHGQETWIELGLNLKEHFGIDQWQVDAFTDTAFGGNPAAILLIHRDEEWMQKVAMENNLSETSFLQKIAENRFKLRWFTPTSEVALCGHATLAAAHTLKENALVSISKPVIFETIHSGELAATYLPNGSIQLSFPSMPVTAVTLTSEEIGFLKLALKIQDHDILFTGRSLYDLIVEIRPEAFHSLENIQFSAFGGLGERGVVVTCAGISLGGRVADKEIDSRFDFFSRCFFPLIGINEDAVTGSAHCALCPYWLEKGVKMGVVKDGMVGKQNSPRGGIVEVRLVDDRVLLSGTGVTTLRSKILA